MRCGLLCVGRLRVREPTRARRRLRRYIRCNSGIAVKYSTMTDLTHWQSSCMSHMDLDSLGIHTYTDLLRYSIFSNILHGTGCDINTVPGPSVTQWQGLDQHSTYEHNCATHKRSLLEKYGWLDRTFNYEFNSWGWRSDGCREFDTVHEPSLIAVGCSFTFGQGLPHSDVWAHRVADALGFQLINLGAPGQGLTLGTRWLLDQGHTLKDPRAVVVLIPPIGRVTWLKRFENTIMSDTFSMGDYERIHPLALNRDINSLSMYTSDIQSIDLWAKARQIPMHVFDGFECDTSNSLARDLRHWGTAWHHCASKQVLKKIVDKLT